MKKLLLSIGLIICQLSFAQRSDTLKLSNPFINTDSESYKELNNTFYQTIKIRKKKQSVISTEGIEQSHTLVIYKIKEIDDREPEWKYNSPKVEEILNSSISLRPSIDISLLPKGVYNFVVFGEANMKTYKLKVK